MTYISGSITEESKIIVLDSNHNKITSKDFTPDSYTKLLLHFDEVPLLDSCAAPKTLTLNGSVARSATQNKFGGYSGSFNGSTQFISIPDSEDWNFGSGNFTIDMWVNFNSLANHIKLFSHGVQGDGDNGIDLSLFTSSGLSFGFWTGGSILVDFSQGSLSGWSTGQWYHIAIIRNGNVFSLYRNGILLASQTAAVSYPNVGGNILIGRAYYNTVQYMNGYMDEYRISKGIARWTANFTPPAEAYKTQAPFMYNLNGVDRYAYSINNLTSTSGTVIAVSNSGEITGYHKMNYASDVDSYTKLLIHFEESFLIDHSSSNHPISNNGGMTRDSDTKKFGSYSGYFNGSSSYLSIPNSDDFNFGSGDFTIDAWVYPKTGYTTGQEVIGKRAISSYSPFAIAGDSTTWRFISSYTGSTWNINVVMGSATNNNWQHLAVTRSGGTIYLFNNGVLQNTVNVGSNSLWNNTELVMIGRAYYSSPIYYNGYIDELRVSKGIARWTSNFTPPTIAYI